MIKKSLIILGISVAYLVNAQDVSTIKNTIEVYSDPSIPGTAKYNAMAGSMGALGGDFSVLNTNPAGIGVSIASEVSATLSVQNSKTTTSLYGKSQDYKIAHTNIGNTGGIAAINIGTSSSWKFVNMAVNYSSQKIEDYTESPGNSNLVYSINDQNGNLVTDLSFEGHAYNRYGTLTKLSVGVAGNYDNKIYVGAGLNFHSAIIDQYDSAEFYSSTDHYTEVFKKQYTPFSEISNGFSASIGIIGKISPQIRFGAAIETPTWWNIAREYSEYENPVDGRYTEDRSLSTPMKATVSAAFVPSKNFALNVDYTLGITKPKYQVYGSAETELNKFFTDYAKNISEIKIGAEYRIQQLRLRAGYALSANPFDTVSISNIDSNAATVNSSYSNLILGKRNTFGAGLGYDFKAFFIDAAYQNISSEYSNPFIQGSSAYNTGYFSKRYIIESDSSIVSNVKNNRNNFFLTFGWKF